MNLETLITNYYLYWATFSQGCIYNMYPHHHRFFSSFYPCASCSDLILMSVQRDPYHVQESGLWEFCRSVK